MTRLLARIGFALLVVLATSAHADDLRHDAVINGVRLTYWESRPIQSNDVPVVYLHGGPGYNVYSFRKTAGAALAKTVPMVYLDERGSGASERPWTGDYSFPTIVQDIEGLRKALGVQRMVVMGHSFGGILAAEYAAAYPDHVAKLILVDAAIDMPGALKAWVETFQQAYPDAYAKALGTAEGKALQATSADEACQLSRARFAFMGAALRLLPNSQAFRDLQQFHQHSALDEQKRLDSQSGYRNTGEIGTALLSPGGSMVCYRVADPQTLSMPTLVIVGAYDRAVGVAPQKALAAKLPRGRFVEFEQSAHFPYQEEPDGFQREVLQFLSASK
ncbi:alpha/beta fold hydrolase [Dyella choica]|nr:alpha/beta hydrolase [Dyella choica]